ncbi:MAG: hypothetical protein Q8Q14_09310 [Gemmatimonadales bacterium]|nr:hypothetical protein [Gemmatimonadales bacterium]
MPKPAVVGSNAGYLSEVTGAAWVDYTAASAWGNWCGRPPADGHVLTYLYVHNTGVNDVCVLGRAGGATPTTEGFLVPAGEYREIPLYGLGVTTFALASAGGASTARLFSRWLRVG